MKSRIALFMLCLALVGCNKKQTLPDPNNEYAVVTVGATSADLNTAYPATIKGIQDIEIRPKISGFITQVCVDEGDFVHKGQPLFRIDPVQYQEAVRQAQASIRQIQVSISSQKLTVNNKRMLFKKNIISNYDLQLAENQLAAYEAQLASARAQLAAARDNLSYCTVTSPVDGVVGLLPYRLGSLVSASSVEPLTTVSNITKMYVYFSMTEKQLLGMARENGGVKEAIKQMPAVQLQLSDGTIYELSGRVSTAGGIIDQTTGSVNMRATFDNPRKVLRSGGTAQILVPTHSASAILVPQKATTEIQDKKYVFVVTAGNKVKSTEITVLDQNDGENYVVTSGLKIGDRIVVEGVNSLKDETVIKPITPAQAAANLKKAKKDTKEGKLPF